MSDLLSRFLRYVNIETTSSEDSNTTPSTKGQLTLAKILADELEELGAQNVIFDEIHGYVYAKIPATKGREGEKVLGFLSHMDTSPEASGRNIKANIIKDYDGQDILLNKEQNIVMSVKDFPELLLSKGKTIITTDGTTLLGADDKAGIAEIMTMISILCSKDAPSHGPIAICFTPDEEIGAGVDNIDLNKFGADIAYTVDGGRLGELEYENFNAAYARIDIKGRSVHPGDAKDKMINAIRVAEEFDSLIPDTQRPETTKDYEGFFHLESFSGQVETSTIEYIVRDHDTDKFNTKKAFLIELTDKLNKKYGEGTVNLTLKDQYYNMATVINPDYMELITNVEEKMKSLGITPLIKPIRGGTDGARLSFMGVPCPNFCTGGMNFHGRFEYAVLDDMELITRLLVEIAKGN